MLKAYIPIDHKIFQVQKLVEHLIYDVWCDANEESFIQKLTPELIDLITNHDWFFDGVKEIYLICKDLSADQRALLRVVFGNNNDIKGLCARTTSIIPLDKLDENLKDRLIPFIKKLYDSLLDWVYIKSRYGSKKEYYDELITENGFLFCPCCGYGQIKTEYDKGHSSFDHHLPLKHYPFSVINFDNLYPLCNQCNSDYKGELDILLHEKKIFHPANPKHPDICVKLEINIRLFPNYINRIDSNDKLDKRLVKISFNENSEEIDSWDRIFSIKDRYFGQIGSNRKSWFQQVTKRYAKDKSRHALYTVDNAFDDIIDEIEPLDYLGFLKTPFLGELKNFDALKEAIAEVSGSSKIEQ